MFKWIYSLGVQHERQRIKTVIAGMYVDLQNDIDLYYDRLSEKTPKKQTKDNEIREAARKMLTVLTEPKVSYTEKELSKPIIDGGE